MAIAISIQSFSKSYGTIPAVKEVSFDVENGQLFGLIGPDSAGKTTLMRAICTLLNPDSGRILVQGFDTSKQIPEIRALLGYMPQRFSLYQDLTVQQNLTFFADLFQVSGQSRAQRLKQLYRFSRLEPFKNRAAGDLSGGMKQKLALSCALIHTPQILVLDEPTFGVDPVSRQEFWEILRSIQKEGTTILVSTAYMDEANLCDQVALFFNGVVRAIGTPQKLKEGYKYNLYRLRARDLRQLASFFKDHKEVIAIQLFGEVVHVSFYTEPQKSQWQKWQTESKQNLLGWQKQNPSIEDIFLDLTAKET